MTGRLSAKMGTPCPNVGLPHLLPGTAKVAASSIRQPAAAQTVEFAASSLLQKRIRASPREPRAAPSSL